MAPVIWGLDLAEFKWSRFKSSYMFKNTDYHLRRTKFVVYQLAMILCVVSESLGTAALSDYLEQEDHVSNESGGRAYAYNNDIIGVMSFNIFFGIFNAFIFGAAFFFDLQWPERKEIPGVRLAWRICSVLCCLFGLGDLIAITVVVSSHSAHVSGVSSAEAQALLSTFHKNSETPQIYHHNGRAVASLVFIWLGYPFVVYSTIIMWLSLAHYRRTGGPFSTHAREAGYNGKDLEDDGGQTMELADSSPESRTPQPATPRVEDLAIPAKWDRVTARINASRVDSYALPTALPTNTAHPPDFITRKSADTPAGPGPVSGSYYDPTAYDASARAAPQGGRPVQAYAGT